MTTALEQQWNTFCSTKTSHSPSTPTPIIMCSPEKNVPSPTALYISTKTKIVYLNTGPINLDEIFWRLPVIPYARQDDGVIKKQMKTTCYNTDEVQKIQDHVNSINCAKITHIRGNVDSPTATHPFISKVNIGLCKKDIISQRNKEKGAFYNCFMLVLRVFCQGRYNEVNLKVFNTGKLSFPGMLSQELLNSSLNLVCSLLTGPESAPVTHNPNTIDTVLVNSNFNCGFYIDRDILVNILKYELGLHVSYDPCSYPGIQCKYFMSKESGVDVGDGVCRCERSCAGRKGTVTCQEVSFMVFRTGSVLIVGRCSEETLHSVYDQIKAMLIKYHARISTLMPKATGTQKGRVKKRKTKYIIVTQQPVVLDD